MSGKLFRISRSTGSEDLEIHIARVELQTTQKRTGFSVAKRYSYPLYDDDDRVQARKLLLFLFSSVSVCNHPCPGLIGCKGKGNDSKKRVGKLPDSWHEMWHEGTSGTENVKWRTKINWNISFADTLNAFNILRFLQNTSESMFFFCSLPRSYLQQPFLKCFLDVDGIAEGESFASHGIDWNELARAFFVCIERNQEGRVSERAS